MTMKPSVKKVTAPSTTGETVTVACNMPNGLMLRVFDIVQQDEPIMGGGFRKGQVAVPKGAPVTIFGNRVPFGVVPKCKIIAGYALTPGVPKDFWDLWLSQNKDSALVTGHIIHAHKSLDEAEGASEEHEDVRSGLEPLLLDGKGKMIDPRVPRKVETAAENANRPAT